MAAVLDLTICCKRLLKTSSMEKLMRTYGVTVKSIYSIDNWRWENQQALNGFHQITEALNTNKIIIVELISPLFKDLGIYIENENSAFIYTVWINTEGYSELDCDFINSANSRFYSRIYQMIFSLNQLEPNVMKAAGIGMETCFTYRENYLEMIRDSRNFIVWIVDEDMKAEGILKGCRQTKWMGFSLFEKSDSPRE